MEFYGPKYVRKANPQKEVSVPLMQHFTYIFPCVYGLFSYVQHSHLYSGGICKCKVKN